LKRSAREPRISPAAAACIRENRSRLLEELKEFIRIQGPPPLCHGDRGLPAPNEKLRIGNCYSGILTVTHFLEKCGAA
jgi:hypothetical protein